MSNKDARSKRQGRPSTVKKGATRANGGKSSASSGLLSSAPITFFITIIIVILGAIQLLSTFHTYALNLAELNSLKNEEASLIAQKEQLDNDIDRWGDDAYVTAQARERLGFVFPGERSIRILHPEAVTGKTTDSDASSKSSSDTEQKLPWYKDMFSSFEKADATPTQSKEGK
ncbi:septum formation initiator [Bifidobacterium primatium]|uniref:Septum formation initiator n=1 Tax=Bifidobacterium primatium TaxID=2045438 RepID=A0A2M9H8G8_9BIFI|nr:septum formation initiator family protein [Bifidobacterium primatium]PJM73096.1 septum formation initiator [Bifidobacterium primatium]